MKKTFRFIGIVALIVVIGLSMMSCGGENPASDFKYEMTADKSGIQILEYIGKKGGKVVIPAKIEGFPVISIGNIDDAFHPAPAKAFGELSGKDD